MPTLYIVGTIEPISEVTTYNVILEIPMQVFDKRMIVTYVRT